MSKADILRQAKELLEGIGFSVSLVDCGPVAGEHLAAWFDGRGGVFRVTCGNRVWSSVDDWQGVIDGLLLLKGMG